MFAGLKYSPHSVVLMEGSDDPLRSHQPSITAANFCDFGTEFGSDFGDLPNQLT